MRTSILAIVAAAILGLIVLYSAAFTVREDQQAIVLQFGRPVHVVQEAGLHWKVPFMQNVVYFDKRERFVDIQDQEVTMQDQKRMRADAFAVYRIVNPLDFLIRWQTIQNWERRLDLITGNILRGALAQMQFGAMLTPQRLEFNRRVTEAIRAEAEQQRSGIEIVEVRLTRTDVPDANAPAIFERMKSERQREASQERAEGAELGVRIRAEADRDRVVLIAEAMRQAAVTRGAGDAEATRIYADAFNRDPQFYAFWRSLQAYQRALGDGSSTMVLSPEGDFFRYFNRMRGSAPGADAPAPAPGAPQLQPPVPAPSGAAPATPAAPAAPGPRSQAIPPATQ